MSIVMWALSPHPPLLVPGVGGSAVKRAADTRDSLRAVAAQAAALRPERIVIISPHAPVHPLAFPVFDTPTLQGDMGHFRCPDCRLSVDVDRDMVATLVAAAREQGVALFRLNEENACHYGVNLTLDHGTFVPLYYLREAGIEAPIVLLGTSGLPLDDYVKLGQVLAEVLAADSKRTLVVASGDLSHRLLDGGAYDFDPAGPVFDAAIIAAVKNVSLTEALAIPAAVVSAAGQCGYRPILFALGSMVPHTSARVFSYEGPYGVGYGVVGFYPPATDLGDAAPEHVSPANGTEADNASLAGCADGSVAGCADGAAEDVRVRVARRAVELWVRKHQMLTLESIPAEVQAPAGTFVTLKMDGDLRGCIGTLAPTQSNQLVEVVQNAISACSRDPRFTPVSEEELPRLHYQVYVLGESEAVAGLADLDPQRYGVIVSKGGRRGVLLPALEGIDSAEMQVAIAARKGGIDVSEGPDLARFEVVTYEEKR